MSRPACTWWAVAPASAFLRTPSAKLVCPLLTALVGCLGTGTAVAQMVPGAGVQLYGALDIALTSTDRGNGQRVTALTPGVQHASYWGVRGSEDIGQGQHILFQLEQGLELDSGNARSYAADPASATPTAVKGQQRTGFNRRSHVGWHSNSWGTLLLGRDYTAMSNVGLALDVMHAGSYGNLQSLIQLAGGTEGFGRISDGVFYTSPLLGGWRWHATYGLPRQPEADATGVRPPKDSNTFHGLGVQYTQGAWLWGGVYQTLQAPATRGQPATWTGQTQQREDVLLGVRYTSPRWSWSTGGYQAREHTTQRNLWLGATWQLNPASRITTQVQRLHADNASGGLPQQATVWGVNYLHQLSKRTALFATYGRTYNDDRSSFWLFGGDMAVLPTAAGQQPRALGLGVSHRF